MAYGNILFNFFLGDDFVHLTWLSKAVHNPSLLARNFNHNWLDIQTFRFYRPFISVVMFSDYMIWGANGLGFHLTNVLYHLASALLVFSITRQLASKLPSRLSTPDFVIRYIANPFPGSQAESTQSLRHFICSRYGATYDGAKIQKTCPCYLPLLAL
jgi:hypothetical protein